MSRCRTCGAKHHTTIHIDHSKEKTSDTPLLDSQTNRVDPCSGRLPPQLIKTAIVDVQAESVRLRARAQFDGGSTVGLITTRLARMLKAPTLPNTAAKLSGINGLDQPVFSKGRVKVTLIGKNDESIDTYPQIVENITPTPTRLNLKELRKRPFLEDLTLADPRYASLSRIDMLIDVETSNACHTDDVRSGDSPGLKAHETIFGWTLSGGDSVQVQKEYTPTVMRISPEEDPVQIFRDLLVLEEESDDPLSQNDQDAIRQYLDHVRRDEHGRYHVSHPRRHPLIPLGKSRKAAVRRFLNNERSLLAKGEWENFSAAVDDYLETGHAEEVPEQDLHNPAGESYYLPMHGVKKETSTSTKLRVVFDASAKSCNGQSLNDTLLPGPSLHPLLPSVLTSFRTHEIAFSGDISKMFRGIGLNPEDRDYHRYVQRHPDGSLQDMRHKRLTFGVTSSPFLANQVIRQIGIDYKDKYPLAAKLVTSNYYVDDCLAGADSVEEAYETVMQSVSMMKKGCLDLKKWRSNSSELLDRIPKEMREESDLLIPSTPADCSKALGLHWGPRRDDLYVAVPVISIDEVATRRRITSTIARIFDVLGFFSPCILLARVLLQRTWDLKVTWDDKLPQEIQEQWRVWLATLPLVGNHPIPRYFGTKGKPTVMAQLHGFADASLTAYGGVVYLRSFHSDMTVTIRLVASKTRLVPGKKKHSVPRLELCGAMMLAQLMSRVQTSLHMPPEATFHWSDSSVVLGWLQKQPGELKPFVCNRVVKINDITDIHHWRHVEGELNPADLLSRGVTAEELKKSSRWWQGPPWLIKAPEAWPRREDINRNHELPELKGVVLSVRPASEEFGRGCSSFDELV